MLKFKQFKDVVYGIPCKKCNEVYIVETSRTLETRLKAVLNCCAQQAQNVLTHLQIHFLMERYKIGKPDHGSDL